MAGDEHRNIATDLDPGYCYCGQPLHFSDPLVEAFVTAQVRDRGRMAKVTFDGNTWLVDRFYVALHGLKAAELPSLGFQQVT